MTNREQRIRERAYSIWESEGGLHGRNEDHWFQAEKELGEAEPQISTDTAVADTTGLHSEAPQDGTEDQEIPPMRTGQSGNEYNPVEGSGEDNPIHHEGRLPADPLAK
ncbi:MULTISPECIES: DUF2934 domain-containing protein [unclassified Rhizobium]|uniref:DUF2934 domain-containing protein n=1 Tax=unclassified Rhizobium TaxID=2613769 RepID=UPI0009E9DA97|nr:MULTISPECIES: DUF2934 domain-containing protein [unclassified Rhizobium]